MLRHRSLIGVAVAGTFVGIILPVLLGAHPTPPTSGGAPSEVDADSLEQRVRAIEQALGFKTPRPPRPTNLDSQYHRLRDRVERLAQRGDSAMMHIPSISPVANPRVSSPYTSRRFHPVERNVQPHFGLDLAAPHGSPIRATANGIVVSVANTPQYGRSVDIDHGNGYLTRYAHAAETLVSSGQRVQRGDLIARVGATGRATGPHVHYEVFVDGWSIDPFPLMTNPNLSVGGPDG